MDAWVICDVLISKGESRQGVQKACRYTQTIGDLPWIHFHWQSIFEGDKVLECWKSEFKSGCRAQRCLYVIVFQWQPSVCCTKLMMHLSLPDFCLNWKVWRCWTCWNWGECFSFMSFHHPFSLQDQGIACVKYIPKTNQEDTETSGVPSFSDGSMWQQ